MKKPTKRILTASLTALGIAFFACSNSPETSGGDGDTGDGDGDTGDGDIVLGDGDGDGDTGSGDGDGDTGDGDGDTGLGGALATPWDYPEDITFDYTPIEGGGDTCGSVQGTPQNVSRPIDIVFVIDNSSSMSNEIKEVEANIKANFADIIDDSEIDYRVILISRYGDSSGGTVGGSDFQVCIPPELGATSCTEPHDQPLINAERFFHFSADIESWDALCVVLESFDEPDEFDDANTTDDGAAGSVYRSWTTLAPNGWGQWLRVGAFKTFVMMTDDDVDCNTNDFSARVDDQNFTNLSLDDEDPDDRLVAGISVAGKFDEALLSLSATHFGTAEARNYIWHSVIGLEENDPENAPWLPDDPIQTTNCDSGSSGSGTGYQNLSTLTGGLRYPICPIDGETNFDPIFYEIAQGVIDTALIPCEYDFPEVEGIINPDNIVVNYEPDGGGESVQFNRVTNEGACGSGNDFYFDDNTTPTKLFLCSGACDTVQDDGGDLQLDFGCLGQ